MASRNYDFGEIEKKWQSTWSERRIYSPDLEIDSNPFYNLWMFPYPSGEGLHAGHAFASTGSDVYGRYQRMKGRTVFQPIGYDSFGIHSENYAIKIGSHPVKMIPELIKRYEQQLRLLGHGYDWKRTVTTSDVDYYKWTQWVFLKVHEAGLVQRKRAKVNWCPSCKTVLADEQVISGECERCSTNVEQKEMEQWFFNMSTGRRPNGELYVDSLLKNIDSLDWSEIIKTSQKNWIGKKEGAVVKFDISGATFRLSAEVFTTRLDTIFGVTYLVLAPEVAKKWIADGWKASTDVIDYLEAALKKTEQVRKIEEKEKTGIKTDLSATNLISGKVVPVYVADYVLDGVGTGIVMGVPAHDERDKAFATKHGIEIVEVIKDDKLVNSGSYEGLTSLEALEKILNDHGSEARKETHFHLRDWLISRQRYWGAPIPMVYCEKDGWQAIKESELPVVLPYLENFKPTGSGVAPLAQLSEFVDCLCPVCGGKAKRETDVCDTFLDSSWYFLRYPSVGNDDQAMSETLTEKWLPVDRYTGGAEHANLHLLYARFVTMVLFDLGIIKFEEPFKSFRAHGLLIKDGHKMSKSKGNVISPDGLLAKYGADTLRCYLMFIGPFESSADFRDAGIAGMNRWLKKVWEMFVDGQKIKDSSSQKVLVRLHKAIAEISKDVEQLKFNTALATLMEVMNIWKDDGQYLAKEDAVSFLKLLAPLAPHMTEELYDYLMAETKEAESIHLCSWPSFDPELVKDSQITIVVQVGGKVRGKVILASEDASDKEKVIKAVLASEDLSKWMVERYETVFVPNRLINFVIK